MASSNASEARIANFETVERLLLERSDSIDRLVRGAFNEFLAPEFAAGVAAFAVGGYGRRELFPHSDVDVLLLVADSLRGATVREPVGRFLRTLWDSGLRVSQSVNTLDECCLVNDQNIELSISLLDRRPLGGDQGLAAALESRLARYYGTYGKVLARHLARLTRSRHSKYQNTIYHLEPNIKETPGGLRDVQVVRWFAKLQNVEGAGDLNAAWRFLAPIRLFLHERSRRDDNLLSFETQDAISAEPASMMRSYYRYARSVVSHALEVVEAVEYAEPSLARQFREWRSRLSNADFTVARNRVFARSPGQLASDSGLVFRLIEFVARHGMPLSPETARRIASAPHEIARDARFQALWPALRAILSQPSASVALRAMQATGVLATLMPEWNRIDCLVVRDFYHRYTVDEHTIVAIESLENIEDKRFRDLLGEIENVSVLRFALLMHDTGKGSGRDHTGESERLAASVGERIGMPQEDLQTVRSLIQRHLELSSIMNSRDLEDASTARALADRVGTVELLRMLALMTYADISAVNPTAMTPWRAEQLWRAYLLGYHELTRELEAERIHDFADADSATRDFVEGLPNRYLRTHTIDQVHGHAALSARVAPKGAAVEISRHHGYWQVVTIANDRPGLFAAIAGALAAFGMNILKAEAFANSRGLIVDTFTFADPLRTLELNPSEVERLHDTLVRVLLKKQDVKRLLASRRPPARRPRRIEPRVSFDNEVSETATFIEVVAEDRPGLLYDLTSTMSRAGCDIVVVLIDTEADRALDVFYVTSGGAKLAAQLEETLRNDLLAVCSGSPGS